MKCEICGKDCKAVGITEREKQIMAELLRCYRKNGEYGSVRSTTALLPGLGFAIQTMLEHIEPHDDIFFYTQTCEETIEYAEKLVG